MISEAIRAGKAGGATRAAWLDEDFAPLAPRNVYGVTKLEAERLCRRVHDEHGLAIARPAHRPLLPRGGRHPPPPVRPQHQGQRIPQPPPDRRGRRRRPCRRAGEGAGARLRHLHPLRAAALRAARNARNCSTTRRPSIARHFPEAPALYARMRLVAARLDRPGLRSVARGAPAGLSLPHRFRRHPRRDRAAAGNCPSPTIPPMSRPRNGSNLRRRGC